MGTSTLDEVTEAYGMPTDQYEEKDNIYLTYEYGIYKQADLVFDVQDEILYKAVLKNYREPEDSNEEVSKETPAEVLSYQAPGAFPEDIMEFVVRYGAISISFRLRSQNLRRTGGRFWRMVQTALLRAAAMVM